MLFSVLLALAFHMPVLFVSRQIVILLIQEILIISVFNESVINLQYYQPSWIMLITLFGLFGFIDVLFIFIGIFLFFFFLSYLTIAIGLFGLCGGVIK